MGAHATNSSTCCKTLSAGGPSRSEKNSYRWPLPRWLPAQINPPLLSPRRRTSLRKKAELLEIASVPVIPMMVAISKRRQAIANTSKKPAHSRNHVPRKVIHRSPSVRPRQVWRPPMHRTSRQLSQDRRHCASLRLESSQPRWFFYYFGRFNCVPRWCLLQQQTPGRHRTRL